MRSGDALAQTAPERGLPVFRAAVLPILDPVRPIDQVLGVDAGKAIGQLETSPLAVVGIDQTLHARVIERGQQRVDVPAQILFLERGIGCAVEHARSGALQPLPRLDQIEIRRDAARSAPREFPEQPAPKSRMRDDNRLLSQNMRGSFRIQRVEQRARKRFRAAVAMDEESGHPGDDTGKRLKSRDRFLRFVSGRRSSLAFLSKRQNPSPSKSLWKILSRIMLP